jgi:replicative DNA helicase
LAGAGRVVDVFSVSARLNPVARQKVVAACDFGVVPSHVAYYVSRVVEASVDRKLSLLALEMQAGGDVAGKIEQVKTEIAKLQLVESFELPDLRFDLALMLLEIRNPRRSVETCFARLNALIVGLKPSGLYVFGARPGVGKTVVGLQLAWEIARSDEVLFFSLEMDKSSLLNRAVSGELNIPLDVIERNALSNVQLQSIDNLISGTKSKLIISDRGGQTVAQLRAYALAVMQKQPVKVIVVDYLQLITPANARAPKYEQISQISIDLKNLAKELAIPVVALAQLNRRVDNKPDDRPNASDLRDSGQIEQDADVIVMLSRRQSDQDKVNDSGLAVNDPRFGLKSLICFDVVKNRHGATGMFDQVFDGAYSRVKELH